VTGAEELSKHIDFTKFLLTLLPVDMAKDRRLPPSALQGGKYLMKKIITRLSPVQLRNQKWCPGEVICGQHLLTCGAKGGDDAR